MALLQPSRFVAEQEKRYPPAGALEGLIKFWVDISTRPYER